MVNTKPLAAAVVALAAVAAPSLAVPEANVRFAIARLEDAAGRRVGTVTFSATPDGARIMVQTTGVAPGVHGVHVHANPSCADTRDESREIVKFGGAGPHFDPMGTNRHGPLAGSERDHHAGDLGNITVSASGAGALMAVTSKLSVEPGRLSVLGRAIVVHAGPDDERTAPSGNSGPRVACGVIRSYR